MEMQTHNEKIETIIINLKTDTFRESEVAKNQEFKSEIESVMMNQG